MGGLVGKFPTWPYDDKWVNNLSVRITRVQWPNCVGLPHILQVQYNPEQSTHKVCIAQNSIYKEQDIYSNHGLFGCGIV
jgi:hypothetical protein